MSSSIFKSGSIYVKPKHISSAETLRFCDNL